jgi:hypothetical protein
MPIPGVNLEQQSIDEADKLYDSAAFTDNVV